MRRGRGSAVQGGAQTVVVLLEGRVVRIEFEDPGDSGDIDSGAHQFDDPLDDLEIVVAVAARPTRCACGVQQPSAFVQAQGLRVESLQFGGHRDAVDPAPGA